MIWACFLTAGACLAHQVAQIDIELQNNKPASHLQKRYLQVSSEDQATYYTANLTIGSPPQSLSVLIDTTSSDLWVLAPDASSCKKDKKNTNDCSRTGTFNSKDSTDFQSQNSEFHTKTLSDVAVKGLWGSDQVSIGSTVLNNFTFGIASDTQSTLGVLGLGYPNSKSSHQTVPQRLKDKRVTRSTAYSLWMNDVNARLGSILFGGIDTAKSKAPLITLPSVSAPNINDGNAKWPLITLDTADIVGTGQYKFRKTILTVAMPALLDSTSPLIRLPPRTVQLLITALSAVWDSKRNAFLMPCPTDEQAQITLDFTFSGHVMSIPVTQITTRSLSATDEDSKLSQDVGLCRLLVGVTKESYAVLGTAFLRSAYVVFDLEHSQISIASTVFNTTESKIEEIPPDGLLSNSTSSILPPLSPAAEQTSVPVVVRTTQIITTLTTTEDCSDTSARSTAPVAIVTKVITRTTTDTTDCDTSSKGGDTVTKMIVRTTTDTSACETSSSISPSSYPQSSGLSGSSASAPEQGGVASSPVRLQLAIAAFAGAILLTI